MYQIAMRNHRDLLIEYLKSQGNLKSRQASNVEKLIYNMSKNIADEDDLPIVYFDIGYSKLGEIVSYPHLLDEIIKDIKENVSGRESCIYNSTRDKKKAFEQKPSMKEGDLQCKNIHCKSKKCEQFQLQTRSLDEGATTYVVCSECGSRYKL